MSEESGTPTQGRPSLFASRALREAVLVALVPAVGYSVAYAFAMGRALDLGIPDQLISISLPDVFRSLGAVIAPLILVYLIFTATSHRVATTMMKRLSAFRVPISVELVTVIFLKAAQANWHWWAWILGTETLLLGIYVVGAMLDARRGEGTYRQRLARVASTPQTPIETVMDHIFRRLGLDVFLTIFAIAMVLLLSFYSGWGSAANQRVFFQKSQSNDVLVAVDGNDYVFESYSDHELTGSFTLIPSSERLTLKARNLGPLATPKICAKTIC